MPLTIDTVRSIQYNTVQYDILPQFIHASEYCAAQLGEPRRKLVPPHKAVLILRTPPPVVKVHVTPSPDDGVLGCDVRCYPQRYPRSPKQERFQMVQRSCGVGQPAVYTASVHTAHRWCWSVLCTVQYSTASILRNCVLAYYVYCVLCTESTRANVLCGTAAAPPPSSRM